MNQEEIAEALLNLAESLTAAEGDKCGEKGCIRNIDGAWRIMSGKTGKLWPQHYDSKEEAENVLKRYHGWGFGKKAADDGGVGRMLVASIGDRDHITVEEMQVICPPCARQMQAKNMTSIKKAALRQSKMAWLSCLQQSKIAGETDPETLCASLYQHDLEDAE